MGRLSLPLLVLAALIVQGCGFTPVYATREDASAGLAGVNLVSVAGRESIEPLITTAFERRKSVSAADVAADYDLILEAEEFAQRLAVQIDASVTRYNYLLRADYTLIRREDGKKFRGSSEAVASFNVVTSQYSTLFAEEAAKEKAARSLIEALERDILLTLGEEDAGLERERRSREAPAIEFDREYSR